MAAVADVILLLRRQVPGIRGLRNARLVHDRLHCHRLHLHAWRRDRLDRLARVHIELGGGPLDRLARVDVEFGWLGGDLSHRGTQAMGLQRARRRAGREKKRCGKTREFSQNGWKAGRAPGLDWGDAEKKPCGQSHTCATSAPVLVLQRTRRKSAGLDEYRKLQLRTHVRRARYRYGAASLRSRKR